MFRFRTIVSILLFFLVFVGIIFGSRWIDGYQKAKSQDGDVSFEKYVQGDIAAMIQGAQELKQIIREAQATPDVVRRSQLNKLAQVLDLYHDEQSEYPQTLDELVGTFLDERSKEFLRSEGLTYRKIFSGYELSIVLDSKERYTLKK